MKRYKALIFALMILGFQSIGFSQKILGAIAEGDLEYVTKWMNKGEDIDMEFTKNSETGLENDFDVISWAAIKNQQEIVRYFVANKSKFDGYEIFISRALGASVQYGDLTFIQFLISEGANVNLGCQYCKDVSPIAVALAYGYHDVYDYFKRIGASENLFGGAYELIHAAASQDSLELLKDILAKQNDNLDLRDVDGYSPLLFAVSKKLIDNAEYLISKGADVAVITHEGTSLLHVAALTGDTAVYRWAENVYHNRELIVDIMSLSVFAFAIMSDNKDLFDYFMENYLIGEFIQNYVMGEDYVMDGEVESVTFAFLEVEKNTAYFFEKMNALGFDWNVKDQEYGRTLKQFAKWNKNKVLYKLLKEVGAK